MKLKFESWVENANSINDEAKSLFVESIVCYKAGACRASLLLSYLAFTTCLKHRFLNGDKPIIFPQGEWDEYLKKVRNEDKWESTIFDLTQLKEVPNQDKSIKKSPVFTISDSLRDEIKYWKDRRNECAHNKDSLILEAHVEVFWAFLQSNLGKITIEGGMDSLIQKIEKHYDVNFTPKGRDVTPLINEIESAVPKGELLEFWKKLFPIIDPTFPDFFWDETILNFLDLLLQKTSASVINSFYDFLKSDNKILVNVLSERPRFIIELGFSAEEIRNFWKVKIQDVSGGIDIYANLVRNNMIPNAEIDEANSHLVTTIRLYVSDMENHLTLVKCGFSNVLREYLLLNCQNKDFNWMNKKSLLIYGYLKFNGIDSEWLVVINKVFAREYYPFRLLDRLDSLINENPSIKKDWLDIAKAENVDISDPILKILVHQ
ncbi:hypothetical protein ACPUEN_11680 [Algoriphagus yeomjeoni]|uniref:hypothetical protein n=1 Tax=Algoriphagus yeomjeoni TaxID=291403 RepID=UPI003CE55CBB